MILDQFKAAKQRQEKQIALLIDPDKASVDYLKKVCRAVNELGISYLFVGGSLIHAGSLDHTLKLIKEYTEVPTVIFPGSNLHISSEADAILLLSLVSGRNPDLLIGQHVTAAPLLKRSGLEVISTAYMLVDGGKPTTVSYISGTQPLPADKPELAACTALAAQYMGSNCAFMDAGSGAETPVSPEMIHAVSEQLNIPLIIGGGIRTPDQVADSFNAGADIVVIGSAAEEDLTVLYEMKEKVNSSFK